MKLLSNVLASVIFLLAGTATTHAQSYDPRRTITVSGHGEVMTPPNKVVLSMSVETHNFVLDKARQENDAKVAAVLAMARASGVEDKYVQTAYMEVEPRYAQHTRSNGDESDPKFIGYYVTKQITIDLRDISKFEKLVAEALKLGTNFIHSTEFGTTELRKYRDEARINAIRAAKEKATALAGELGQKVGKPIVIGEDAMQPLTINRKSYGTVSGTFQGDLDLVPTASVAPGQMKVEAEVAVTFELE